MSKLEAPGRGRRARTRRKRRKPRDEERRKRRRVLMKQGKRCIEREKREQDNWC